MSGLSKSHKSSDIVSIMETKCHKNYKQWNVMAEVLVLQNEK